MKSQVATFGTAGMFPCTAEGFVRALDADYRVMVSLDIDWTWARPVSLDGLDSRTLWFAGWGLLATNIQRAFEGAPMLQALEADWRIHMKGVNWLGQMDANGLPTCDDAAPLLCFSYLDRSSFRDVGLYAGPVNAEFGHHGVMTDKQGKILPGYISQTVFDHIECHRSKFRGIDAFGFRKLTFMGESSIERCGLYAPGAYQGLNLEGDPASSDRGQSIITGLRLEHDDPRHIGLRIRNASAMHVGMNRHMLAGMDAELDDSTRYASTVYGKDTLMRFDGKRNDTWGQWWRPFDRRHDLRIA